MADTITLNAGTGGAVLSTDEVTIATVAQHVQRVKLVDGAEGGSALIGGDATNGLDVDVTRVQGSVTVAQTTAANLNVTVGAALPAGTNAIGKLAANTGVDIGDVDVTSLPTGSVAAATAKTADFDTGVGTDTVAMFGVALPASGGAVAGGTATAPLRTDPTGTTTQPVSGTVTANLAAGTNNIGDVGVLSVPAPLSTTGGGAEATALRVTIASDSTGVVSVDDNGAALTVDNAGTFAVQAASAGDVAHDGADSGNPLKLGAKAIAHGTNPTAVAAADRTDLYANRAGVLFTIGGHPNIVTLEAAYTAAQTDVAIITVGAGTKIAVTQIQVIADEANTVGVGFRVGFGATTTPTTTGVVLTHPGMVPGSGVSRGDGGAILGIGADGDDLRITAEVPTGGSIRVLCSYFTIES